MKSRIFFAALAALALLAGLWAGLVRIGWALPPVRLADHGPLMISGFLGTLISLERAAAFRMRWSFGAPLLSGLGAAAVVLGWPAVVGRGAIVLGSLVLAAAFGLAYVRHYGWRLEWAGATLVAGALCWAIGNALWLVDRPLPRVSLWWIGFLLLTIAGERLELSRVLLSRRASLVVFVGCVSLLVSGLLISLFRFGPGVQVAGIGLAGTGLWLLRFDVARHTARSGQPAITRFIAICLLPGYVWLVVGGSLWIGWGAFFSGGLFYDAMLHVVLLGFVFSMIFAHAPIIAPALTGLPIRFHPRFYLHLALLHGSLVLRLAGDLAAAPSARAWGGMLNAIAILLFLGSTLWSLRPQSTPGPSVTGA